MKLILFTDNFPYGNTETFLENEIPFLSDGFDQIIIVPLHKKEEIRSLPQNVTVEESIISFSPKDKKKLLINGLLNLSPIIFSLKEFFTQSIFTNKIKIWNFFTSLLLFRSCYSNKKLWNRIEKTIEKGDKLYFYWGDKSALMIPFLKNKIKNNDIFVRFHRTDLYEEAKGGYIPFRKRVFMNIDHILPISLHGKNYLCKKYSYINENKLHISRLGTFDHGLNPESKFEIEFHLLTCSNVVPVKRLDLLINALSFCNIRINWTHIGAGILFNEIQKKSKELPSNIKVLFLGNKSNKEVIDYYSHHHIDLFVNVSSSEGVPVSIMEALSFGIPVLATDVGGTAEIVDENVGELLPANISEIELANRITTFAAKNHQKTRLNARKRWEDLCDANKNYTEFVKFIKQ